MNGLSGALDTGPSQGWMKPAAVRCSVRYSPQR
jgi:hypothetical protein